ncbi:DUF4129 domain-containing protein [Halomarina litorea]|uniref:DUF4129 domain-containing protein n=1 Tax=Halomarina litorea TaxID=2961595 RepID=UPI0020C39A24|nr:DUF4129 domain-containing protein [Halomarina sp. BCD28]
MNVERVVSLGVILAVIVAMGVSATTLESSLSSNPDEVIDLDYENIPLGQDAVRDAKDEVEQNKENPNPTGDPRTMPEQKPTEVQAGGGGPSDDGPGEERSLLDRLLDLLMQLLPFLLALLALLVLAALARRYGRRLLALLLALVPQDGTESTDDDVTWTPHPRNDIERAWLSMLDRAGVQRPRQMTPAECANQAVAAGLDPDGVQRLRTAFEKVRYGGGEVTDEDARQAREGLRRMGLGGGGSLGGSS